MVGISLLNQEKITSGYQQCSALLLHDVRKPLHQSMPMLSSLLLLTIRFSQDKSSLEVSFFNTKSVPVAHISYGCWCDRIE